MQHQPKPLGAKDPRATPETPEAADHAPPAKGALAGKPFAEQEAVLAPGGSADQATNVQLKPAVQRSGPGTPSAAEAVELANAQSRAVIGSPAEVVVTAVDANSQPSFSGDVAVPFEAIVAGMRGGDVTLEELRGATNVQLVGCPDRGATASLTASAAGLSLHVSQLSAPQGLNACGFMVTLQSGKRVNLTLDISQFHTDITLWEHHRGEKDIEATQASIDSMSGMKTSAEEVAAHPPTVDVSAEQSELTQDLAALAATNAQIQERLAALRGGWQTLSPAVQGLAAAHAGDGRGGATPANTLAASGQALNATLNAVAGARSELASNRHLAEVIRQSLSGTETAPGMTQKLGELDATAQALEGRIAALEQEAKQQQADLERQLEADGALFEQVLASNESLILNQPGAAPDRGKSVAELRKLVDGRTSFIRSLQSIIDRKLAEPANVVAAARTRVASADGQLPELRAQLARQQAELAALRGPIYAMLGKDGRELPKSD